MLNDTDRNLLSVALNPSLQKSLMFGDKAWKPLEVNRATESWTQIGGKGQTFGCAATKFKNTQVSVVQFLGGTTGQMVQKMLNERRPPSQQQQQTENKDDLDQEGVGKFPLGDIEQVTVWLEGDTRICTTLLDARGMTEMIEPAVHVPAPKVRELLSKLTMRLLGQNRHPVLPASTPQDVKPSSGITIDSPDSNSGSEDESSHSSEHIEQRQTIDCVSINGSFPPGITLLEVCGTLSSAVKQMCPRPVVLCDAYNDVEIVLTNPTTTSLIDILKINGEELAMLAQACKDAGSKEIPKGIQEEEQEEEDVETCRWRALVSDADVVFTHASPESNLQWIVVSDGARGTFGIWRAPVIPVRPTDNNIVSSSPSSSKLSCWHISPPPIDSEIVNPIGAGDTLAGVLLRTLKIEHTSDIRVPGDSVGATYPQAVLSPANVLPACAIGTAAATASCCSKIAAEFDLAKVQRSVSLVSVVQRC